MLKKVFSHILLILLNTHKICSLTLRIIHMNHFSLYSLPYIPVIPFLMRCIRLSGTFIGIMWDTEVYAHIFQGKAQFFERAIPILLDQKEVQCYEALNSHSMTSYRYSSTRRQSVFSPNNSLLPWCGPIQMCLISGRQGL